MKLTSIVRIARDKYHTAGLRGSYWDAKGLASEVGRMFNRGNKVFRQHALRDQWRYLTRLPHSDNAEPVSRLRLAVEWLLHAQQATQDNGVPVGYFPCRGETKGGWMPSYPETTGYIITSLLAYAERFGDQAVHNAALRMANWEVGIQMSSGAVQGGPVCPPEKQTAAAFNTGMVLDGWCSAYKATGAAEYLEAGRRAADFLVGDLDENDYFRTNGAYVSPGEIKTYTCLCAWAIYRFGDITGESRYRDAATRVIEAALRQQRPNGWFAHNCLTHSLAPLTHTMGYTLQGVLEVGVAAARADFISAARRGVDPLVARLDHHGLLAGRYYADWEPGALSSCLTGNAQIAIVCYRLSELTGERHYKNAADRMVETLKDLQETDSPNPALNGAIAGSFPLFGGYMRAGYPNWATKYFVDALLLQHRLDRQPWARNNVLSDSVVHK
ncbi:MAG TPA: hypothetical protein VFS89_09400 [Nitrosospira sp.]|nr:hypothetical protein [Nitrosospira sp.]